MKRTQKLISIILMVTMLTGIISIFPVSVSAANYDCLFPVNNGKLAYVYGYSDAYGGWHTGIDIHSSGDDTIYAACSGTVVATANSCTHVSCGYACEHYSTFGNYIKIKNSDGTFAYYGHLKKDGLLVSNGATVTKGQAIGIMGSSGYSTGKHLHFEMRLSDGSTKINVNPTSDGGSINYSYSGYGNVEHTCNQNVYYSYWAAHPHYYLYKCSICGTVSTDYNQTKYIEGCTDCYHECNQDVYYSYWEAHPHYYLYKCSICGTVSTDYNQTRTIESCVDCNSYKPVLNVKPEGDGYINFTWNRSEDVDVYELKIYDSNEELRFHYTDIEYSNFSTEIPAGSYVAYVCVVDSISEDNIICSEGVAFTVDELGNTTATEHTHDYGITEEVASSCKNLGYTVFTCSCGDTYTSNHSAFGAHKAADEWTVIKLPTETESGIACRLCIYCNTQVEYQIIESGDIVTSPTTPPDATFPSDDSGNTYKYGDVDLNGKINIKDATAIQKNVAKITALGNTSLVAADVNADGKVNVKDATAIQKYLANIPVESRIGETFSATDNFYSLVVI